MNIELKNMLIELFRADHITYVIDADTCDLINIYGIEDDFDTPHTGEKCYEILYGLTKPCEFCDNKCRGSNRDHSSKIQFVNSISGRKYICYGKKVTWNKQKNLVIKTLIDVTTKDNNQKKHELLFPTVYYQQ